jgi:protein TonB
VYADGPAHEPVEDTLRLISTDGPTRVTIVHEGAAVHEQAAEHIATPARQAPPVRSPAATVELLRASLRKEAPPAVPANAAPVATPVPETRPVHQPPDFADEQEATELRLWAAGIPANRKHRGWIWMAVAAFAVAASVLAIMFRDAWWPRRATPVATAALQLTAALEDDGLIGLHWNEQSVPVIQAREGRLQITEDDKPPRSVSLRPEQLAAGHLFYESSAERVAFQLAVTEKSGAVVQESVVAAKKPEPIRAAPSQTSQAPSQGPSTNSAVPSPVTDSPIGQLPLPGVLAPGASAPRTFTPPPTRAAPAQPGEGRVILMEPAPAINGGSSVPAGSMLPGKVDIIPPPPAPVSKQASTPPPPALKRVQVGGKLQGAMLLRKVDPVYPPLARQMRIEGTVRFQAVISKEGEVQDLKYVSGPQALEKAAADAVKHWVYRPTLLDGRPVEVSTQIEIGFTLGH